MNFAHHTFAPWKVKDGSRIVATERKWKEPLKWNRDAESSGERRRVFIDVDVFEDWKGPEEDGAMSCPKTGEPLSINDNGHVWPMSWPSMSDGDDWGVEPYTMNHVRQRLFKIIDRTPHLDWLIVTSCPENVSAMMPNHCPDGRKGCEVLHVRSNLWLGVRVSNQQEYDERIPQLLRVPAAVMFAYCTPHSEIDLSEWVYTINVVHNGDGDTQEIPCKPPIHWVICGGESGHNARPMNLNWARSLRDQCREAGVAFFMKQLGSNPIPGNDSDRCLLTSNDAWSGTKGESLDEIPEDLRVREIPQASKQLK